MTRHHKWYLSIIVCAAIVYVAITAYRPRVFSFSPNDQRVPSQHSEATNKLRVAKSEDINSVAGLVENASSVGVATYGRLQLSIGESTVRQLLLSNNINLVEYAFTRIRRICSSYESGMANEGLQNHIIARTNDDATSIRKLDGRGTHTQRMLAAEHLQKKCAELAGGVAVNGAERDAAIAAIEAAGFPMREWINAKSRGGRREAMIDASTAELGQKLLKTGLIGEIGNLMLDVNSYELPNIVGEEDIANLKTIAADYILMCRMGEDCGPNSLAHL